jgi:CubicO group peptidase (beta-lactamase class C family)
VARRIDSIFSRWDKTNTPGCALAVLKDGKIVYERGYGMSNLEYNIAITPSSRFHVASISKQFTAAAIQHLALEGKLSLDDDIRKYLPEVPDLGHTITIAHLIHHTSGLRDQWDLQRFAGWRDDDVITEQDVLDMVKRQRALNFVPGSEYVYCNTGYTLLGVIVKRVTGVSLRDYADSVFFKPLGMSSTVFHSDHTEIVVNRTSAYERRDDGRWAISIPVFDNYGATSLFTTVEDLAKWDENFYTARVGGEAFIHAMLMPGIFNNGKPQSYASGLALGLYKGYNTVEHSGADAGYRANILRFPGLHFSVIVLANLANINTGELSRRVADLFLPSRFARVGGSEVGGTGVGVAGVADNTAVRWAGDYFNPVTKYWTTIEYRDGKLFDGPDLARRNDSVFVNGNGGVYIFSGLGGQVKLRYRTVGSEERVFDRVQKVTPSPAALAEYAGTYHSAELDAEFSVSVKDSGLSVKPPRVEAADVHPYIKDVFSGPFLMEFDRDKRGRIVGFRLSTGRVRNLNFVVEK